MQVAAAYIRVSTDNQLELSPDSQIKQIREYAKRNGFFVPDEYIFRDDGISGRTTAKRLEFKRMIGVSKIKPKPFEAILVWKFSRFARNREDSIVYKSMLRKHGIDVISISENVGDDKMSILIEALIEAMDEYYSINLAEEVKRGMLEKFNRGKVISAPPLGYIVKDGVFTQDENADLIRRIFDEYISGKPMVTIARDLNTDGYLTKYGNSFENRTVEYILRNPVYIGKQRLSKSGKGSNSHFHNTDDVVMIVNAHHKAIISDELFNKVQEKINITKKMYRKSSRTTAPRRPFMLAGLVRCSNCGATLCALKHKDGVIQNIQCHNYTKGKCQISHSITLTIINKLVIEDIEKRLSENSFTIDVENNSSTEIKDNSFAIKKEKEKLKRVKQAYELGVDTLEEYKENKTSILNRIENLKQSVSKPISKKTVNDFNVLVKNVLKTIKNDDLGEDDKNKALRQIISKIVYNRTEKTISVFYYY